MLIKGAALFKGMKILFSKWVNDSILQLPFNTLLNSLEWKSSKRHYLLLASGGPGS